MPTKYDDMAPYLEDASIIVEYRIRLPMTVDEHEIARLYTISESNKLETGGGEGYEVVKNEPSNEGQYTYKILHLQTKVPRFIRTLAPTGSLEILEEAWNAYPKCKTSLSNPYMKDGFLFIVDTLHFDNDDGTKENVFEIPDEFIGKREIVDIDIANNSLVQPNDYKKEEDPTFYHSKTTGRGPLATGWQDSMPTMCVYKLCSYKFKWFGLQPKVESLIKKALFRGFTQFFRRVHCWTDSWHGLTIEDIRKLEEETKTELDKMRNSGEARGLVEK
ncbi:phosphatidylinositol transfer protein alpha isoform-like isoform X1 [Tubulanus polymorphus]|uniref:phosphatidylinositol transfer protein alpha isoform-like isoform X1 n=1 Tax=Tubulanus polymorphus TaxID=672921 RepID=UPI003DA4536B